MGTIAQPNFRHYTIQEGLSVNAVYSITQDSKGFLWFGTIDGLNRFDGRSIKTYRLTPGDEQADIRLGNIIYALCEDAQQQLWIASDRGVARFDLRTERFLPFALNRAGPVRTPDQRASAVATDAEGRVWMALFGQGLFCYTPKTGATKQFLHNPNDPHSLASNNIRRLYFDASGTLWLSYTDVGIARFDSRKQRFANYALTPERMPCEALFEDSQGTFWVGNDTRGLIRFDRRTGQSDLFLTEASPHYARHIRGIVEYQPGMLMIASDAGLTFFDTQSGEGGTYPHGRSCGNARPERYLSTLPLHRPRTGALGGHLLRWCQLPGA